GPDRDRQDPPRQGRSVRPRPGGHAEGLGALRPVPRNHRGRTGRLAAADPGPLPGRPGPSLHRRQGPPGRPRAVAGPAAGPFLPRAAAAAGRRHHLAQRRGRASGPGGGAVRRPGRAEPRPPQCPRPSPPGGPGLVRGGLAHGPQSGRRAHALDPRPQGTAPSPGGPAWPYNGESVMIAPGTPLVNTPSDAGLARVLEQYLGALEAGTAPDREVFLAAHPQLAGELRECLASLDL